ncbi:MAG: haloacid dehalogenase-like hydrolase [Verrucomicrobiaceae bacterium]|nr:haloacid dehalogenase-like hydrolase [Verrucomicrobiaceae bacterium]
MQENENTLHTGNIIACVWDFDKTLIDGYMQTPIFKEYGIDESLFWKEVNMLPEIYAQKGIRVSPESVYLNHLLSFVKNGKMSGLSNAKLRELGGHLEFCAGLPEFFNELKNVVNENPDYKALDIKLEHYIISTGLAEMIRGSKIAEYVDDIFACEFVEEPMPPYFSQQPEFDFDSLATQINQIGMIVDNTIKTRFIFEINKGSNKNPEINVNAKIREEDRRVPIRNMIYIADGPSDVPVFSVVRKSGGKAFAVYSPKNDLEFEQNDFLLASGRIDSYGPNDYTSTSNTSKWLKMHVKKICDRIVKEHFEAIENKVSKAPTHLHKFVQQQPKEQEQELF